MSKSHSSYDPAFFAQLFQIEDRHFWFRVRNQAIAKIVEQVTRNWADGYRILEIGCGTGNVLRVLNQVCARGFVIGMDLFAEGLQFAKTRTEGALVAGDMQSPPFATTFNLIGLFDVLEHLPDDEQVLQTIAKMLAQDGVLLLTVPADPRLWSYFDEASHHCRRYTASELETRLTRAGYRVEYLTPYMASLFPLMLLGRRLATWLRRGSNPTSQRAHEMASTDLRITPILNDLLAWWLDQETRWIDSRRRLPFGTSLLAVARKA